jgi:hypothetical protein
VRLTASCGHKLSTVYHQQQRTCTRSGTCVLCSVTGLCT